MARISLQEILSDRRKFLRISGLSIQKKKIKIGLEKEGSLPTHNVSN